MLTAHDQRTLTSVATNKIAPGHRYDPRSGSGIEWTTERVRLWLRHEMIAEAPTADVSMWDFWYGLRFVDAFPQVTHWWFGSPWTGRVRLWEPSTMLGGAVAGYMQFVDEDFPLLPWTIRPGDPPRICVPMPPLQVHAINLPLRSVLAAYAVGVVNGRVTSGEWRVASALVASKSLPLALPAASTSWCLDEIQMPLRRAFCELQSIAAP